MLGCMEETSVGIAAAAALAGLADWVDLDGNLLLASEPFSGLELDDDCRWRLGSSPGLGVERSGHRGLITTRFGPGSSGVEKSVENLVDEQPSADATVGLGFPGRSRSGPLEQGHGPGPVDEARSLGSSATVPSVFLKRAPLIEPGPREARRGCRSSLRAARRP